MPRIIDLPSISADSADSADWLILYNVDAASNDAVNKIRVDQLATLTAGVAAYGDSDVAVYLANSDSANPIQVGQMVIDSDLVVQGDLRVLGTTTTVNSANLSVSDKLLILADSALTPTDADGGGIQLNGANATLLYQQSDDTWNFNKNLEYPNRYSLTDTDSLNEGTTNLYYSSARFDSDLTNADSSITSSQLASAVSLIIYDSAGSAIKTLYGAGV